MSATTDRAPGPAAAGRTDILAPGFVTTPYWWDAAAPVAAADGPLPEEAEVAIVGGGYCGLSAALTLAGAGVRSVVLDAEAPGIGASTRSGGMVTGGQKFVVGGAIRKLGAARAERLLADARASFDHIEGLIRDHALDCDYRRHGRFIGACTRAHFRRLGRDADRLRRHTGISVRLLSRAEQRAEIGSDHYHGGLLIEDYGGLHPAKYHRALCRAAVAAGAGVHANAAVRAIRRGPGGFVLETARGRLSARQVVVATNGYTGPLVPYLQRRVVAVRSHIIATEPLPEALRADINPGRRMISDTRRDVSYFRLSPDGSRVLFGGCNAIGPDREVAAARRLHAAMCRVWPQLRGVRVSHAWGGQLGFTRDRLPHIGVHQGVHYALGCNGSGVAMNGYLGHRIALMLMGREAGGCAFAEGSFPAIPSYRGRPWFVPLLGASHRVRDWLDRAWDTS